MTSVYVYFHFHVVPPPSSVNITAVNTQIVSQSLKLVCYISVVRGITSRVDIMWSSNGVQLKRIEGANVNYIYTSGFFILYKSIYDISQLNTSDDDRAFQCEVTVNTSPLVKGNDNITLNLTG